MNDIKFLEKKVKQLKKETFETILKIGKGHLGGSFSCAEILVSLYYCIKQEKDKVILSKGHANNLLNAILKDLKYISEEDFNNYTKNHSLLCGHCDIRVPGIETTTGSLGHGLGIAAGMALADKLNNINRKIYVILGDGECQEGSIWEALLFINHHQLNNMIIFIDRNKLGAEEFTENNLSLEPLFMKFVSFGFEVKEINGHDIPSIINCFNCNIQEKPYIIIANTIKGKDIIGLENTIKSHHTLPKNEENIKKTLENLCN